MAGISFGNFLIKRVAAQLSQEFSSLKTFATLSPIPGYLKWLRNAIADGQLGHSKPTEHKLLIETLADLEPETTLLSLLSEKQWLQDGRLIASMKVPLIRLAAHYLAEQKGHHSDRTKDPVAHFHLSNGAIIERLNWMGDRSKNGLNQSAGLMVNYLYDLSQIDENHEAYSGNGRITVSTEIKGLL